MRTFLAVARFDDEHVGDRVGLGVGFSLEGQRAHDDFSALHPTLRTACAQHRTHIAHAAPGQPGLTLDQGFQGLQLEPHRMLLDKQLLTSLRLRIGRQQLFAQVSGVGAADVHLLH